MTLAFLGGNNGETHITLCLGFALTRGVTPCRGCFSLCLVVNGLYHTAEQICQSQSFHTHIQWIHQLLREISSSLDAKCYAFSTSYWLTLYVFHFVLGCYVQQVFLSRFTEHGCLSWLKIKRFRPLTQTMSKKTCDTYYSISRKKIIDPIMKHLDIRLFANKEILADKWSW